MCSMFVPQVVINCIALGKGAYFKIIKKEDATQPLFYQKTDHTEIP